MSDTPDRREGHTPPVDGWSVELPDWPDQCAVLRHEKAGFGPASKAETAFWRHITEQAEEIARLRERCENESRAAGHWMEESCRDHNRAERAESSVQALQQALEDTAAKWLTWAKKPPTAGGQHTRQKSTREMVEEVVYDFRAALAPGEAVPKETQG